MAGRLCRFTFHRGTSRELIEEAVADAIFVAECIHGPAKVRLGVGYYLPPGRTQCLIDTSAEIGQQVAEVFTGFLTRRLGEQAFHVERVTGDSSTLEATRS